MLEILHIKKMKEHKKDIKQDLKWQTKVQTGAIYGFL